MLQRATEKYNRYYVFYTHRWEQFDDIPKGNLLITPNDKRFNKVELICLLVDLLRDYAENTGWTLKGSEELGAAIEVLKDTYEGEIGDRKVEELKRRGIRESDIMVLEEI